ncbi:TetR/AcrR family transcriptional regulator [Prevotella sp. MA2016]|uniref:TetR/AcrR family transcriptional regulator n=1 Tax=Prevotella sp. MA2016 TaxID=1408310 RepID=UPI00048E938D|nr:TetR/AcrR family transcriptional regulator [Prevotella sp. MA2016]
MQIKKEYTRELIITTAKELFLKKGFSKTSMRDIAQAVHIGVSNIYNYFASKDELFRTILAPLISELERIMHEHHNMDYQDQFLQYACGKSDEMIKEHTQAYFRLINDYRDELKLLLYQAQGSTLETFIDDYTEKSTHQILVFMNDFKQKHPRYSVIHTTFTYHVHVVWMFSFISEIIKHQLSAQEIKKAIDDYIQFEFVGWRALMNQHQ